MSFDSENLIALNFNKVIRYKTKTKKQKNQWDQNVSEWNHGWKTGTTKVHVQNFYEAPFVEQFLMKSTSKTKINLL